MNVDGWVTIGTKLDKKQLEKDIRDAERQLQNYDKESQKLTEQKAKIEFDNQSLQEAINRYDELLNKEDAYYKKMQKYDTFANPRVSVEQQVTDNEIYVRTKKQWEDVRTQIAGMEKGFFKSSAELDQNEYKLANINKKLEENKIKQDQITKSIQDQKSQLAGVNSETEKSKRFSEIKGSIEGIKNGMVNIVKKTVSWAIAIFGVRTAYSFLQSSISTLSQYNEQIGTDIAYIRFALASTLEPVIITIVGWVKTALQYVNYLLHTLFGINIFAGASAKRFQESAKGLGSATKNAKELKKQLAGFDEMNVLQDNSSSGGGGGGGGGITPPPSVDFSKVIDFSNFHPLEWLKEKLKQIRDWIYSINWQELGSKVYQSIKNFFTQTDWASVFESIYETWGAILGALAGFIIGFLNDAWNDIVAYFQTWIKKSEDMGGGVIGGLLLGILNAIYQIGKWIWDHIYTPFIEGFKKAFGIASPSKVMMEMGTYIIEGLKNGLINIWNAVKSIFENLKNNMINIFKLAWEGIKKVFSTVGSFFGGIVNTIYAKFVNIGSSVGNAIGGTFKSAINSVLSVAERVLNTPISAINKLINKVNELPGVSMSKLSRISLPRLAKGGIINQPGRGVMVGSAIVGERGAEGVIPLTDSQQMALLGEAIGKYITVNASITNTMNGRVISRELHRVQNENDFAYNR